MKKIFYLLIFIMISEMSFAQVSCLSTSYKLVFSYFLEKENFSRLYFEKSIYLQFKRYKVQSFLSFLESHHDCFYDLYQFKKEFFYEKNDFGSFAPLRDFKLLIAEETLNGEFKKKIIFCDNINDVLSEFERNHIEPDFNHITPPPKYERVFFLLIKPAEPLFIGEDRIVLTLFTRVILGFKKEGRPVSIDGYFDQDRTVYVFDIKKTSDGKIALNEIFVLKHNTTDN